MFKLYESLRALTNAICSSTEQRKQEFDWLRSTAGFVTKNDLKEMENKIMSAISDFLAKQTAFNTRQETAVAALATSLEGVTGDVQTLNDKITELQNSSGAVTPEDQAVIDTLQTQGEALSVKLEAFATALEALNALTPPKAPPTP